MRQELATTGTSLLVLHRQLLKYQTDLVEKSDKKKYSAYDLLGLSLNDPRFNWLRRFSDLIIQIDIIVDDKKNLPFDAPAIAEQIKSALSVEGEGAQDLRQALLADSSLMFNLGLVKKNLIQFERSFAKEIN